jgi:hypothetical protein
LQWRNRDKSPPTSSSPLRLRPAVSEDATTGSSALGAAVVFVENNRVLPAVSRLDEPGCDHQFSFNATGKIR